MLFPEIRKIHEVEIRRTGGLDFQVIRMLYEAIVQYKDSASRQLLLTTLKKAKDWTLMEHAESIWVALSRYPDPVYSGITPRLKIGSYRFKDLQGDVKRIEQ